MKLSLQKMNQHAARSQKGSALVFSLGILTAVTLGAVVGMQRSSLQLRMVGNLQLQQQVFNSSKDNAESVVADVTDNKDNKAVDLLNDVILAAKTAESAGRPLSSVNKNPHAEGIFTAPRLSDFVKDVGSRIRLMGIATNDPIRCPGESVSGGQTCYYFEVDADATGKIDSIISRQTVGFRYKP